MLLIAAICHLIAAVTIVLRVDYTPSFCCQGDTSLSVSRFGSSPSYELAVPRYGFSPSVELSTARVGGMLWEDVCCGARVEPLSVSASSSLLLGPCSAVAFGYIVGLRASRSVGLCATLIVGLCVLLSRCLCALLSVGFNACLFIGHCALITVSCLRALPSVGLRVCYFVALWVCYFVGLCAMTLVYCFFAILFYGLRGGIVIGRYALVAAGFIWVPIVYMISSGFYCYICFCFLFTSMILIFLGVFTLIFATVTGLFTVCMLPLFFIVLGYTLFVGYWANTIGIRIGRRVFVALLVCILYVFGPAVTIYIFCSMFIYTAYEACFVNQTFDLERFFRSRGYYYPSFDEVVEVYANAIWPPMFSFGFFCLGLSCYLFDIFLFLGNDLSFLETFVVALLFFSVFRFGVRPFFVWLLPSYYERKWTRDSFTLRRFSSSSL